MNFVKPKKYLGQHFLKDQNIARKIVNSLTSENSTILEIGPGTGVLTKFLFEKNERNVFLIEIDIESYEFLIAQHPEYKSNIIHADFLKTDILSLINFKQNIENNQLSIIGNFPYNISSQIFFKVLDLKTVVGEVVCMIQKEVAERISAKNGSKTYGILSVLLQAYYDIEYLFTVNESVFNPPPKVKSAVIRLKRNKNIKLECNEDLFLKVVKTSFNQRRKTLSNSLKPIMNGKKIENPIFQKRPEQLSVNEFVLLTNLISEIY